MNKNIQERINSILMENGFPSIDSISIFFMDLTETGWSALEFLLSLKNKEIEQYLFVYHFDSLGVKYIDKETFKTIGPHAKRFVRKFSNYYRQTQMFDDIITSRLILSKPTKKDAKEIINHYKNDGDFLTFCGSKYNKYEAQSYVDGLLNWENNYSIKLKNGELVGYVALNVGDYGIGDLSYYIFKEMRRKGLCQEACNAVINEAFAGNFYEMIDTVQNDKRLLEKKPKKVETIKARCLSFNDGSNGILKSLGFTFCGYDYKSKRIDTDEWASENIYYLDRK